MEYTISTFGYVDYQAKSRIRLKLWSDETGCTEPTKDILNTHNTPTAYLMKRGGCNYYQKAKNVHIAGGRLAVVMVNKEDQDPKDIIPIVPNYINAKTGQFFYFNDFLESKNIPPVVIIEKNIGDILRKTLESGEKIVLHVDYDMVKNIVIFKGKI